ncbi:MAG: hypothetical protein J7K88_12170 [Candidatus Fermentibacteraceae bacterium]|nr:hypothetical protein [Candidatus Fermentibacteraceae bacterium]
MIVVVIIGILAAIAIPKYSDISETARRSACRANMRTIASQESIYFAGHMAYTVSMTLIEMNGVVCPASVAYTISVPNSEEFNITCANTPSHGSILNGVPSWHDSSE